MSSPLTNWAGNHAYGARAVRHPSSVDELRGIVARARRVKALGTRHSFSAVADTDGDLVALDRLPRETTVDRARMTVTCDGGATYGRLCGELARAGLALHNMASLPHISVAGACATGTHGSGDRNASLASAVRALELVDGRGEIVRVSDDDPSGVDALRGAAVGLGALGIVTRVTLDVQPAYEMTQHVYEGLSLARLDGRFDELMAGGYSVSLFTSWREARVDQVWVKRRADDPSPSPAEALGAAPAADARHPVPGMPAESCTAQLGAAGPWHERLPHFRMEFTPSSGAELQSDYLVPRERAWEALLAVASLRARVAPLLQVAEVRTVAADDCWMSPCHGRACVSLHFTWTPDWPSVRALLPALEARLLPLGARPHWGKLFTVSGDVVRSLYPELPGFRALAGRMDPDGKFRNAFLEEFVLGN